MGTPNRTVGGAIFLSRWLQAPLYFGLIVAQGVYVCHFLVELYHLVMGVATFGETEIMLSVLGLIDVVMIANLMVMVIVGGYETFVSRLHLGEHPDEPEWLSHVNAGVLKVKLATALVGISSIHLLKTFINAEQMFFKMPADQLGHEIAEKALRVPLDVAAQAASDKVILWQLLLHLAFVISALFLAWTDRISAQGAETIHHIEKEDRDDAALSQPH